MTTTTDTLTRWAALWEMDESLRPPGTYMLTTGKQSTLMMGCPEGGGIGLLDDLGPALVRDAATRWMRVRGNLHFGRGRPGSLIFIDPIADLRLSYDMDSDDDALYTACKAVLGEDKT